MAAPPTPTSKNAYQVNPQFPAGGGATAADVYVLPPSFQYLSPTTVTVPNVYLPPAPLTVPDGSKYAEDFTLQWNGPGVGVTPTTDNTTLTLTILNANQWRSDAGSRAKLQANFEFLATALDGMEYTTKSLVPGATNLPSKPMMIPAIITPITDMASPFCEPGRAFRLRRIRTRGDTRQTRAPKSICH